MAAPTEAAFIVIGAGPVGCAVASLLHKQGHQTVIYERLSHIEPNPETSYPIGVNPRGLRTIRQISEGLESKVKAEGLLVQAWEIYAGKFKVATLRSGSTYGTTRAGVNYALYTDVVERGIPVHFNHKLKRVFPWESQAIVPTPACFVPIGIDLQSRKIVFDASSNEVEVDASKAKVLACDGCYSSVRKALEEQSASFSAQVTVWGSVYRALFSQTETPKLDPAIHYVLNGTYAAKASPSTWAVVLGALRHDRDHDFLLSADATDENVARLKAYIAQNVPKAVPLIPEQEYTDFWARRSFAGQVVQCNQVHHDDWILLMGDAAHSVHPSTGEGVNSGLEDAKVLCDVVAEVGNTPETFAVYNARRIADLEALGRLALYNERGTWDKRQKVAGGITNAVLGIGRAIGASGPPKEEYMFGTLIRDDNILSYSEIVTKWEQQMKPVQGFANSVAKLCTKQTPSPQPSDHDAPGKAR